MQTTEQKVRVFVVEFEGSGRYVVENPRNIADEIRDAEIGDKYTISVEEWDRADLDALPEFDGW